MTWLEKRLAVGEIPPRCSVHECVKAKAVDEEDKSRRCIFCKYYTKKLNSSKCNECLKTEHLDNFMADPWYLKALERFKETHDPVK